MTTSGFYLRSASWRQFYIFIYRPSFLVFGEDFQDVIKKHFHQLIKLRNCLRTKTAQHVVSIAEHRIFAPFRIKSRQRIQSYSKARRCRTFFFFNIITSTYDLLSRTFGSKRKTTITESHGIGIGETQVPFESHLMISNYNCDAMLEQYVKASAGPNGEPGVVIVQRDVWLARGIGVADWLVVAQNLKGPFSAVPKPI